MPMPDISKIAGVYQPFIDLIVSTIDRIGTTPVVAGIVIWQLSDLITAQKLDPMYGAVGIVLTGIAFLIGRHYERAQKTGGTTPPTTPTT